MLPISLEGQVGLVTGAGSAYGIGRSMVLAAVSAGAKAVYACDLNLGSLSSLQAAAKALTPDCVVEGRQLDVSSEEQTLETLREILERHGRFDFFFANAGYAVYRPLSELTSAHFLRAVDVMQKGPFLAVKYGAQAMSVTSTQKPHAKGNIVITSSCAAFAGAYADLAYTAVKKACNGIVESGSVQLSASNIRVNGIAPGCTKSSILTSSSLSEDGKAYKIEATQSEIEKTHAKFFERGGLFQDQAKFYNRTAEPEEIANLAVFLASDLSLAINGQVILADSGKTTAATGEDFPLFTSDFPNMSLRRWTHLVRFLAKEDGRVHLGQINAEKVPDIGLALEKKIEVQANLVEGGIFDGCVTDKVMTIAHLLSPLQQDEVPIIRCMGLNYRDHAKEANMDIPDTPVLFIKPRTALNGPSPAKINIPGIAQDGTSDYEAELSIVISKTGRNIPRERAMDYVLGYTASNDVSARAQQFKNSQWCFSKGFDGSCPLGPVLVAPLAIGNPQALAIKATLNGTTVQDSNTSEMIFDVPSIISFFSQGTTLERGTVIMTGTGPGIGAMRTPKLSLKDGDDMRVEIEKIGTLINEVYHDDREKPQCRVCVASEQECKYPLRPLKPGPKIDDESQSQGGQGWDEASFDHEELGVSDERTAGDQKSWLNMQELSFILHPSHKVSSPEEEEDGLVPEGKKEQGQNQQTMVQNACQALSISQEMLHFLLSHPSSIRLYFENMVAIKVFHQPMFASKLSGITSLPQLYALLSALLGYASRFYQSTIESMDPSELGRLNDKPSPGPDHFLTLAFKFIDESLEECGDEQPPLCILQALIVATHCQLTRGVHGRAWRSLGLCVRVAYELNLHLVDAQNPDQGDTGESDTHGDREREKEEKRRAWWAIWEMDVFASTIRRTPTAVNWDQIETLLPIDDADWFKDRSAPSAFMERDPVQRWKSLNESGNRSPKAWFLVINSLMKDAQIISSPHGVQFQYQSRPNCPQRKGAAGCRNDTCAGSCVQEARQKLEILANSVQCFVLALPEELRYRSQYLGFDNRLSGQSEFSKQKQIHCGIYNIYVMTQLARLMIYRYGLFGTGLGPRQTGGPSSRDNSERRLSLDPRSVDNAAARQYFEAADNIFTIVNRSSEDHIKHINPFLLSTIWLASAVQLVHEHYGFSKPSTNLVKSRFDVLYLTYKRCVSFWDSKTAMGQNLEMIERTLEGGLVGQQHRQSHDSSRQPRRRSIKSQSSWVPESPGAEGTHRRSSVTLPIAVDGHSRDIGAQHSDVGFNQGVDRSMNMVSMQHSIIPQREPNVPAQKLPDTPPLTVLEGEDNMESERQSFGNSTANASQQPNLTCNLQRGQHPILQPGDDLSPVVSDSLALDDFSSFFQYYGKHHMGLSDFECTHLSNEQTIISSSGGQSGNLPDMQPQDVEWHNLDMPLDLQDLLTGYSTY
ncbi:fungal specific transcription factor factor [Fusarium beomiforme]|uniref:Fungal specific transcription factor factor n=1 Tax=Fusarium beomiforme TaxID=44412 RepID=A0A9P5ADD4_9HYPO|nr:fungal specific transcription factor factor [Fusarium beomiforme]